MAEQLPKFDVTAEPAGPEPQLAAADIPLLRIERVVKKFGTFRAVDGVSLDIRAGEFFALLGPSGCGKTTLLRMLAGFESPDEGRILLNGRDIANVLPHERPVNMMFQNYALFPHLSVRDNIAFGLKRAGMARSEIDARVAEMVALVKLEGLEKRKPDNLSGGQKQRVALARSLARRPQMLLLAEPRQGVRQTTVSVAIRPEKVKLSRLGPAPDAIASQPINRLEGIITDVSYLGALTTYKVRLDSGAILRSSMANTARIDIDAYNLSQRVVAWFTPDDCLVLEQ